MMPSLFRPCSDDTMTTDNIKIHTGDLLVASPLLSDPNFSRSVILILDKNIEQGYLGLVLNRQLNLSIEDLLNISDDQRDIPVYSGGPVDLQRLFWLHSLGPEKISDSIEILPGIYIGGRLEDLQRYIESEDYSGLTFRLYLGYCGWTKGQLEQEIEHNVWAVNSLPDPEAILTADDETYWRENVKALGPSYRHWLLLPSDPSLN